MRKSFGLSVLVQRCAFQRKTLVSLNSLEVWVFA